jgi:hypothetical protein
MVQRGGDHGAAGPGQDAGHCRRRTATGLGAFPTVFTVYGVLVLTATRVPRGRSLTT